MRIYNNIPALVAFDSLTKSVHAMDQSILKLSTGLRVNSAADDAAGLAISEKMRAQITGLDVSGRNAQNGISLIQTAEGALQETTSMLHRMRELAVQGANDTMTQQDRRFLQLELEQLKDDINRIATTTIFNKKRLLDGSASVLWSSDSLDTRLFVRGGLRQVDQFGQKNLAEGNYKISINASPGQAEVQKSDVFKIKHKNVLSNVFLADQKGVKSIRVDGLQAGNYSITVYDEDNNTRKMGIAQTFGVSAAFVRTTDFGGLMDMSGTAQILFEVTNVDTALGTLTMKGSAFFMSKDGKSESFVVDGLVVSTSQGLNWTAFGISSVTGGNILEAVTTAAIVKSAIGSKAVVWALGGDDAEVLVISGARNTQFFLLEYDDIANKNLSMRGFYLDTSNGQAYESDIALTLGSSLGTWNIDDNIASFRATYIGETARGDTQLRDLDKFWNSEGRFLLENPAVLNITQGDGTSTAVTLYATDTIRDVQEKLNAAYAAGLGQQYYLDNLNTNDAGKFVTFVENETKNTSETVAGTFVLRSIVNGRGGTVRLSGDEDLIKALSLNIIQEARDNQFSVSIQDAHSGQSVASNAKMAGNVAIGLLHPNLDFEFRSNADMNTVWNNTSKKYDTIAKDASSYETIIHIADNSLVFQIGANESEDMGLDIGDMGTRALGVHRVLVTDINSSQRSISIIDMAIDRISAQRAKLGAYQNRLEHTITNLSVAAENLTASESRIRDLDMAKEVMTFTKLNILVQAGNSMLSQANQMPRSVLALLR